MMLATDVYRPAAIDQLVTLGKQVSHLFCGSTLISRYLGNIIQVIFAIISQIFRLSLQVEVPVFEAGNQLRPAEIAKLGLAEAKKKGIEVIIVDTAGRLQV